MPSGFVQEPTFFNDERAEERVVAVVCPNDNDSDRGHLQDKVDRRPPLGHAYPVQLISHPEVTPEHLKLVPHLPTRNLG